MSLIAGRHIPIRGLSINKTHTMQGPSHAYTVLFDAIDVDDAATQKKYASRIRNEREERKRRNRQNAIAEASSSSSSSSSCSFINKKLSKRCVITLRCVACVALRWVETSCLRMNHTTKSVNRATSFGLQRVSYNMIWGNLLLNPISTLTPAIHGHLSSVKVNEIMIDSWRQVSAHRLYSYDNSWKCQQRHCR